MTEKFIACNNAAARPRAAGVVAKAPRSQVQVPGRTRFISKKRKNNTSAWKTENQMSGRILQRLVKDLINKSYY